MSLMTHRHFLVLKNPSPLTLHTRYVILLYQLHYCINLILNHRKSRTCLIELFKVSLTQHIYTNYQLHNCINLLILITHLNCYELNACIVLAFIFLDTIITLSKDPLYKIDCTKVPDELMQYLYMQVCKHILSTYIVFSYLTILHHKN